MYKIQLPNFEGPFDLLLYFIKRDELNIYDIPISRITEEFLEYIRVMQMLDLELAGEFLVMSSTLMQIKSQMLLPREVDEDGEPIEDPRTQLVQKLLEYKQIKEVTEDLKSAEEETKYLYYRNVFDSEKKLGKDAQDVAPLGLFDLLTAMQKVLKNKKQREAKHTINLNPYTVDEQSDYIRKQLRIKSSLSFISLIKGSDRGKIIVTFLSILDMSKAQEIILTQGEIFGDISIKKAPDLN